jgi:hypothetical protein
MPTLDVAFAFGMPVHAARLTAHVQAYVSTLPALNALRACNRFGKGPQCYINKLPVELVQSIAHYSVLSVRQKKLKKCLKLLRCCKDKCTLLDHYSREELLEIFYDIMADNDSFCSEDILNDPDNEELVEVLEGCGLSEHAEHTDNRSRWDARLEACLTARRPLFQKHFGLDIWLSQVCLGASSRFQSPKEATIAYLTLPNRVEVAKQWERSMTEDGYDESHGGYGFAVPADQHVSPRETQRFKRAMKILDLEPFVHTTQQQVEEDALSSTPTGVVQMPVAPPTANAAALFPRRLLLVRNKVEAE